MASYYIDTEFLEGTQDKRIFGIKYGETPPTIDLISIGIVAEDGREYYEVSKDFNLYEAWNRYDLRQDKSLTEGGKVYKNYWIRENVLKPIFYELFIKAAKDGIGANLKFGRNYFYGDKKDMYKLANRFGFTFQNMKDLIERYGKTNKQIAEDLKQIVSVTNEKHTGTYPNTQAENVEFYGYFADYDWVAFCWLFGKMIDLPNGFPNYCHDLKQILDEKAANLIFSKRKEFGILDSYSKKAGTDTFEPIKVYSLQEKIDAVINSNNFPKQTNEHHALADARWNKKLYEFLNKI